jgi:hypothetical protein
VQTDISRLLSVFAATAIIAATETNAAALTLLQICSIQPQIRPLASQRPIEERMHPFVDILAQLRNLRLADPTQPHGPHQLVYSPCRNTSADAVSRSNILDAGTCRHGLRHHHRSKRSIVDATPLSQDLDPWYPLAICGCHSGSLMLAS